MYHRLSLIVMTSLLITLSGCSDAPEQPLTANDQDSVVIMDMTEPVQIDPPAKGWYHRIFWFIKPMQLDFMKKEGVAALRCKTSDSGSIFGRFTDLDLETYPRLTWRWFVETPIASTFDERTKAGDDHPARLFMEFSDKDGGSYFAEIIWSNGAFKSGDYKYIDDFPHFVARGGEANVGHWIHEEVDLLEIYRHISKRNDRPQLRQIAIFCDTDDTGGRSVAYFGTISLSKRTP